MRILCRSAEAGSGVLEIEPPTLASISISRIRSAGGVRLTHMVWKWRDKESGGNEECPRVSGKNPVFEGSRIRARALLDFGGCQGHDLIAPESEDDGGGDGRRGSWSGGQHLKGEKVQAARVGRGSVKVGPAATPLPKKSIHILY